MYKRVTPSLQDPTPILFQGKHSAKFQWMGWQAGGNLYTSFPRPLKAEWLGNPGARSPSRYHNSSILQLLSTLAACNSQLCNMCVQGPMCFPKIRLYRVPVFFHQVFMCVYLQGLVMLWMVWAASRLWGALHVQLPRLNASHLLNCQNWLSTKCWLKSWIFL